MSDAPELYWLPKNDVGIRRDLVSASDMQAWDEFRRVANCNLDFAGTVRLDREMSKRFAQPPPGAGETVRLALLSASTSDHLLAALRVAAARRGLWMQTYTPAFGQYFQELMDDSSPLHAFGPNVVLLSQDAHHLLGAANSALSSGEADGLCQAALERLMACWSLARERFGCQVIQQAVLPSALPVLGMNERRLAGSLAALSDRLNAEIGRNADEAGVDVLPIDRMVTRSGLSAWHDESLWHRAKQEISPLASPAYGEGVGRLIGAQRGLSSKCVVLDLDNTLWGGVIGDDGLHGIVLGQGSAIGEAFVAFQQYLKELSRRGVLLAVCSKNNEENALQPFDEHPDMILKRSDIACFVANWDDKAANIRSIAAALNIGIDSLVFVDDNPFERNLVRKEIPSVKVPELSDDPVDYARCLADAGYFESLGLTDEDRQRGAQYQANAERVKLQASATNIEEYLASLEMKLTYQPFDEVGLQRTVQLINKTNQFNLTTRRYTDSEVRSLIGDPDALTLQLRMSDLFADNGMIGVVIGRRAPQTPQTIRLETWLMSCRVLGRRVEQATLEVIATVAAQMGATQIIGEFIPSAKNAMVVDHYSRLGFSAVTDEPAPTGSTLWSLDLTSRTQTQPPIAIVGAEL